MPSKEDIMKGKVLLLFIPLLFSCSNDNNEEDQPSIKHHSYEEISDKMIGWDEVFKKGDNYCVYFFSMTCKYCDSIKDEVIDVALTHKTSIYFCNDSHIVTDRYLDVESTIGITDINDFCIKGFPSIIKINLQAVSEHCPGKSATLNFVRTLP